ncbi:uncharacterized protein LOC132559955 [Ylistrum balloti]|uniref:uncharacterized protein LOC132559955 n=1 Tax=Ylistrum balloti TaxID=509963 RepID=UPI0029058664|nr:uncharacterized protein LOC132559955 [Ylistrum balloti]
MAGVVYTLLILTVAAAAVEAEFCWNEDDNWFTTWCVRGCCGQYRHGCCPTPSPAPAAADDDDDDNKLSAGDIAGIVVGSIISLALVVAGIILALYFFTTCFRQQKGGVVYSNRTPNTGVASSTNINMATYPTQNPPVTMTTYQYPQQQVPPTTVVYNTGYM